MITSKPVSGSQVDLQPPPPTEIGSAATAEASQRRAPSRLSLVLDVQRGWIATLVAVACLLLIPVGLPSSTPLLTNGLIFLLMAYAWNIVGGLLGEMSFAHMIFWGVGGYGLVFADNAGFPLVPSVIGLVVLAAVAGALVAGLIRAVGLKGLLPVSIFTLVLGQIVYTYVAGADVFGRTEGLIVAELPSVSTYTLYLLLGVLVAVAAVLNVAIANSRRGRKMLAIRDDAVAAQVAGVNVGRQRYLAYMMSAALFGIGGAYQAYYTGSASPAIMLGVAPLIMVSLAVFVGGPGTAMGPLLGSLIIFGLQAAALQASDSPNVSLWAQLIAFAVALVLLRLVTPRLKGLDMASAAIRWLSRRLRRGPVVTATPVAIADTARFLDDALPKGADVVSDPAGRPSLVITDLHKSFGALKVLRGVSFRIDPGEVVGIVGPNGAGKSTLCNLVSGVERITSGSICLGTREVSAVPVHDRALHGMGRSFQTPRLFPSLSLPDNVTLAREHLSELDAEEILFEMGITESLHRRGDDSQFFARRLTEVMKASMQGNVVLMLDEPLAGLTPDEQKIVLGLARRAAEKGACVGIVEHLIPVLAPAVDRIVVLDGGRIVADGVPQEVLQQDVVVEAYLGKPHTVEDAQ